jgi:two-component system, sensor histidine kinase
MNVNSRMQSTIVRVAVLLLLHLGSHISLLSKHSHGTSDIYLPSALSLIFVYWFGPRLTLPLTYINSVASSYLWGHSLSEWPSWFFYGLPEVVYPLLSWFLFTNVVRGKYWLPDIRNTILFLTFGVLVPAVFAALALQGALLFTGKIQGDVFWQYVFSNVLAEFTTTFILTLPLLYHLTPLLVQKKIIRSVEKIEINSESLPAKKNIELLIVFLVIGFLGIYLEFTQYWFVYGFISFFVGMRFGFGPVIVTNLFTIFIAYIGPQLFLRSSEMGYDDRDLTRFFFTTNCMFIFAVLNARVITDLKLIETTLKMEKLKLEHINSELDKFVYSVSHDLTAPLKSILGLVKIGKFSQDPTDLKEYLDKIENSVHKLEDFIRQALDYSRNTRLKVKSEAFDLQELCNELIENVKFSLDYNNIDFRFDLRETVVVLDRDRIKIILNNLISNAVKYLKPDPGYPHCVKISSVKRDGKLFISVEDNGEGIDPGATEKIFEMFYRGNDRSWGSGLGLYIARETVKNLHGDLQVVSRQGEGSVFTVVLPSA